MKRTSRKMAWTCVFFVISILLVATATCGSKENRTVVYTHIDPVGDEGWVYPKKDIYIHGLFDIHKFEVSHDNRNVSFDITFGNMTDDFRGTLGFSHQICQIFVDTDRRFESGSTNSLTDQYDSYAYLTDNAPYEFAIYLQGWECYLNLAANNTYTCPDKTALKLQVLNKTISVEVPLNNTTGTPEKWAYTVWCGSENFGRFRDVKEKAEEYLLGGGMNKKGETQITDFLAEPGFQKRFVFDAYKKNKKSFVNPVGLGLVWTDEIFKLSDPANDTRLEKGQMEDSAPLYDIISVQLLKSREHVIFRTKFGDMADSSNKTNGFGNMSAQIYVDTDNKINSGSQDSINNSQFSFSGRRGWEFMLSVSPDGILFKKYINGSYFSLQYSNSTYVTTNNRFLETKVPVSFIKDVPFHESYESWLIAVVVGIASSSLDFANLCQGTVCLSSGVDANSSNIVDFLNPKNAINKQVFNSVNGISGVEIPFMDSNGTATVQIFYLNDDQADELGTYPQSFNGSQLHQRNGLFDLIRFEVSSDSRMMRFAIESSKIQNDTTGLQPIFLIFVDKDNEYWSGSVESPYNCGVFIHPQNAWEIAIFVDPFMKMTELKFSSNPTSKSFLKNSNHYEGNSLVITIPLTYFGSITESKSWTFAVASGIRSSTGLFVELQDDAMDDVFQRKHPGIPYNIMDFLFQANEEVYSSWMNNEQKFTLPFVGIKYTQLSADIVNEDAKNDECGVYPVNPYFFGKKGLFDLLSFSIQHNSRFTRLAFFMQSIPETADPTLPIGLLSTHVYIDTDRRQKKGCSKPLKGANIIPVAQYYWEYAILTYGNFARIYRCDENSFSNASLSVNIVRQNNMFFFDIPKSHLSSPNTTWNYIVASGAVFSQKDGELAQFTESPTSSTFGGGEITGFGANIVDVILSEDLIQSTLLSSFNVPKKQYATIPSLGIGIIFKPTIWELNDAAGDERGQYPGNLETIADKGLFDILNFSVMEDLESVIFRVSLERLMTYSENGRPKPNYTLVHIYINTDGGKLTGSQTALSNANVDIGLNSGWEYALTFGPSGIKLHTVNSTSQTILESGLENSHMICEGNSIYVFVPKKLLELFDVSWTYVVISGMESKEEWKFVAYSEKDGLTTFGGGLKSENSPNVVDIMTRSRSQQDQILSILKEDNRKKIMIPFMGGADLVTLFSIEDELMDEFGLYTTNPEMGGINPSGLLDISEFNVQYNWTHLILSTRFREQLVNPRNHSLGFSFPIISVYCHSDFKKPGRYATQEKSFVDLNYPWDWLALIHGQGYSFRYGATWPGSMRYYQYKAEESGQIYLNQQMNAIEFYIPTTFTGNPMKDWQFSVFVGLFDVTSKDYSLRNKEASTRFLGGGDDDFYDPNIVDVVLPRILSENATDLQFQGFILYNYDVFKKLLSKVPAIGPQASFDLNEWYRADCPSYSSYDGKTNECLCNSGYLMSNGECKKESKTSTVNYIAIVCGAIGGILVVFIGVAYFYRKRMVEDMKGAEKKLYGTVEPKDLVFGKLLGEGSFGEVYKGDWRGAEVAIKVLLQKRLNNEQIENFKKEIAIMVELRHPNIVLYMGACFNSNNLCLVCELMHQGSLYDVLHGDISIPYSKKLVFMSDICKGMFYLHSSNPPIIHRDLKSLNILVDDRFRLKVSDFGLTMIQGSGGNGDDVGSLLWLAPEVIEGHEYTASADVYSFGIIAWEILSRKDPYHEIENAFAVTTQVVMNNLRPKIPQNTPKDIESIINMLWAQNPTERPTFQDASKKISGLIENSRHSSNTSFIEVMTDEVLPPEGNVCAICIKIYGSESLWNDIPESMEKGLENYQLTVKSECRKFQGYISQNDGENYVILFQDTAQCIKFCTEVQISLNALDWPEEILAHEYAKVLAAGDIRGIRTQMGIDVGICAKKSESESQIQIYSGKCISKAIRTCRMCLGGQIILTEAAFEDLKENITAIRVNNIIEPIRSHDDSTDAIKYYEPETNLSSSCAQENYKKEWSIEPKAVSKYTSHLNSKHPHAPDISIETISNTDKIFIPNPMCHQVATASTRDKRSEVEAIERLRDMKDWEIEYSHLVLSDSPIGTGSFGSVYSGEYKGRQVAIKKIKVGSNVKEQLSGLFYSEVSILRKLKHPNVTEFIGASQDFPNLCIIMELIQPGNLRNVLQNSSFRISEADKAKIIRGIMSGMDYLHSSNPPILHRDIKSSNILVNQDFESKICDFGFARAKAKNRTMTKCGTLIYQAPEVMEGNKYNEKADVYSFGILLWEIETREVPYAGRDPLSIQFLIMNGLRPEIRKNMDKSVISLMKKCWNEDPESRPYFREML